VVSVGCERRSSAGRSFAASPRREPATGPRELGFHRSSTAEKGFAVNTELAPNPHCHPSERIEGESDAFETN
jgi:hypothetical protein